MFLSCTVHDTENLTFSAEFRDCSARNDAELPRGTTRNFRAERRGTSARVPRNFRAGAAELPRGRRGSSARAGADLPCGFGLKMAKTRRRRSCATTLKDRATRLKDRSNYHYRNRTYLEMKYE